MIDNVTAVTYINNMGGIRSVECDKMARKLWNWCIERKIWVTAAHLPGDQNVIADRKSRVFQDETEWMLSPLLFEDVCRQLGQPTIDLFVTRLNNQLPHYIAWQPDPGAVAADAFRFYWGEEIFYAFPPFCLSERCMQKIILDKAEGILIVPKWSTQSWFPRLLSMLIRDPILLPKADNVLTLPGCKNALHPLHKKVILGSLQARGIPEEARETILGSWRESTRSQYGAYLKRWINFCYKRSCSPLYTNVNTVLVFLSELRDQGLHYSAINTARSALATFTTLSSGNSISTDPMVARFLKGIFSTYPPMPRYTEIWNVSLVLDYIRGLPPVEELDLKMLSLKLCFLVAITSAQRLQTLHLLQLDQLTLNDDSAVFRVTKFLKQNRPGNVGFEVLLEAYPKDERLCVLKTLRAYIAKTISHYEMRS
ncbi:hypothetical protein HOLleu_24840 [Holothuria leucospilota]|uniref:Uncharacterized protein n=1 Tax=Holothuria leucospilota TaxID=206669 RepID=A0A9Q1BRZ8_HOLLE|nr:hypothetical protein HOLleu_24840 [Holothuria leucospilota]